MNGPPPTTAELYSEGQRLQHEGRLDDAKERYLEVLRLEANHADAIHCLGNIDARQGRLEDAERLIRRALALDPLKATFVNSLGNLMKAAGRLDEAASLYGQAVQLQPGFVAAQSNLGDVLLRQGHLDEAVEACLKALELDPNHAGSYNNLGRALNNQRRYAEAVSAFRRAVLIRPDYAVGYNHLGHALRAQGEVEEAIEAFEHAVSLDPELAVAHQNLGATRMATGLVDEGIEAYERARELRPSHLPTLVNLGIAYHTAGRFKLAGESYRRAIELAPEDPEPWLNLGLVLNEQRRSEEAETAFREALARAPGRADIYAELAALYEETNQLDALEGAIRDGLEAAPDHPRLNLEAAKADRRAGNVDDAIARLARFDVAAMDSRLAEQFHYQLGYLYDRAGDPESAWPHLVEANRIAGETPRARKARPARFLRLLDNLHGFYSKASVDDWTAAPPSDQAPPVFMLGFPRSGTTLLDLVLDGHPGVTTLEEKMTTLPLLQALQHMEGSYPASLAKLDDDAIRRLRALYFETQQEFLVEDADGRVVVDKMPIRTVQVGMLSRIFPDARFIFSLRHPCDVVLSNFMQHYMVTDAFANFFTLANSATIYDKVMSLWQLYLEKLPVGHHIVRYEDLIGDLEGVSRGVLDFLGVEWDPAVLDYAARAKSRGRINTNSYHQVTETLYTRSRDRWRAYAPHFEPLMDRLGPHIDYFGYER
jgi:tetratricopeptide (TPR) repeat protein